MVGIRWGGGSNTFRGGQNTLGRWSKYVREVVLIGSERIVIGSEVVLIRSERGLDTFRTWSRYVPNVVSIGSERGRDTFRTWSWVPRNVVAIRPERGRDRFGTWLAGWGDALHGGIGRGAMGRRSG